MDIGTETVYIVQYLTFDGQWKDTSYQIEVREEAINTYRIEIGMCPDFKFRIVQIQTETKVIEVDLEENI